MPADPPYEVIADPATSSVRLMLSGEIDIAMTDHLGDAVERALVDRPDTVVADFAGVTFMDSTGIRFLVGFKTRCDSIGAAWGLENVSTSIIRLIEVSGLTDFLQPTR
ncbi:MAG: STAS domain-containing protein [Ilumatobacteraceae bacterium]